ncbi:MAG: histidinol-phosphate transaminase [Verrucomicrobiia bacterium]
MKPDLRAKRSSIESLVRPLVRRAEAYVPGEQPKIEGLVKLNTNENPYGPSPEVEEALKAAIDGRLRLYPNPTADPLRAKLAEYHECHPENIIVGNGSDELLALATRAFVEPLCGLTSYALESAARPSTRINEAELQSAPADVTEVLTPSRYAVQYFQPSYSLYPVLAAVHGAWPRPVPLAESFEFPTIKELRHTSWDFDAALTYVTTPHAPSGLGTGRARLEELCEAHRGVLVLDEAYVDFANENALNLALKYPHVIVSRTFSKGFSLCFLRVGYFVGHPELIGALHKIRDSYNVNGLGQIAAEATLDSLPYYHRNFQRIIAERERLSRELAALGFRVLPSQTNFILVKPPRHSAESWLEKLRAKRVLVRWFGSPDVRDYLRITIGSEPEVEKLLGAARSILLEAG